MATTNLSPEMRPGYKTPSREYILTAVSKIDGKAFTEKFPNLYKALAYKLNAEENNSIEQQVALEVLENGNRIDLIRFDQDPDELKRSLDKYGKNKP